MPIEQDRSRGDPVKTEYGKDQGAALVEPDEDAVELRCKSQADFSYDGKHFFPTTVSSFFQ